LLETYLLLGDNGDHRERARLRKMIVRQGWFTQIEDHFQAIAYTAMQELATRAFYQRVAVEVRNEDRLLSRALNRLAKDETLHYAFYKDAVKLHLEVEPNFAEPLARMMMDFAMPGDDMPWYVVRAAIMAREGIYGSAHHYNMTVDLLWKEWNIPGLAPSAEPARAEQKKMIAWHEKLGRIASRYTARRGDGSAPSTVEGRMIAEDVLAGETSIRRNGAGSWNGSNAKVNGAASANGPAGTNGSGNGIYQKVLDRAPAAEVAGE
jgi:acyl-[acyl-carrier-protein] desaturase